MIPREVWPWLLVFLAILVILAVLAFAGYDGWSELAAILTLVLLQQWSGP